MPSTMELPARSALGVSSVRTPFCIVEGHTIVYDGFDSTSLMLLSLLKTLIMLLLVLVILLLLLLLVVVLLSYLFEGRTHYYCFVQSIIISIGVTTFAHFYFHYQYHFYHVTTYNVIITITTISLKISTDQPSDPEGQVNIPWIWLQQTQTPA